MKATTALNKPAAAAKSYPLTEYERVDDICRLIRRRLVEQDYHLKTDFQYIADTDNQHDDDRGHDRRDGDLPS